MNEADEAVFQAISEAERIRFAIRKKKSPQVKGSERNNIRAIALTWFNTHRKKVVSVISETDLQSVDGMYQRTMDATHRYSSRSIYVKTFKEIEDTLIKLRSGNVVRLAAATTPDNPPDFSKLISDPAMKVILANRWIECAICLSSGAPLAATVMIGGLLEGLLLARIHRESNKTPIFTAKAAPKDKLGKTLGLKEWTLQDYIGVAHELKWITVAAKDVGVVLRDYRNYIHPQKELSHGVSLTPDDAAILWECGKCISRELLK
jgi:hypothetical protein